MQKIGFKPDWMTLLKLLLGGLLVRVIVAAFLFPGFDEAYYYLYSRHLSWSYFDHPPMVAITTGLGWWFTGIISPLTIRIGALALYLISLGLFFWTGQRLYSKRVGILAVAIATLIPLFTLGFGVLTSPDNSLIFFWTITLALAAWEFFPSPGENQFIYKPSWKLCLFGLTIGLACLSKYHGFILGLCLLGFCLTSRRHFKALKSPWLAIALLMFLLTLFPLIYWNIQHDWISFRFQLSMRFDNSSSSHFSLFQLLGYWIIHIAYLFPAFGFPLWWVIIHEIRIQSIKSQKHESQQSPAILNKDFYVTSLLLWLSLPIILGFTLLGGWKQILPAWPAPGFWGITLLLAKHADQWRGQHPRMIHRWLWGSGYLLLTLLTIALLHLTLGTFQSDSKYAVWKLLPAARDPSIELINVTQLNQRIAQSSFLMTAMEQASFVFTNEYYLGGYIAMAIHPSKDIPVTCFSQDPRGFAFWFNQADWLGKDAIYITLERFHSDADIINRYSSNFESFEYLTEVPLYRGGAQVESLHFYRTHNFKEPYEYPY